MFVLFDGIERVNSFKLLGLVFQNNFKFHEHVNFVLRQCSQRLYLPKLLRYQGMNSDHLDQVTHALTIYRLRYALPAWCGFLTTDLRNRTEGLLKRLKRSRYLKEHICFSELCTDVSRELFLNVLRLYHCLNHLLPT